MCPRGSKLISPAITVNRFPMIEEHKDALMIYAPGSGYRVVGEIIKVSRIPYPNASMIGVEMFMYEEWVNVRGEGQKKVYLYACPQDEITWMNRKFLREYKI